MQFSPPFVEQGLLHVKILLVTPPMTQLNTPYPATAYLMGFLRQHEARLGLEVCQADAALELFLRIFSRAGLTRILDELRARAAELARASDDEVDEGDELDEDEDDEVDLPPSIAHFLAHGERYLATIGD